MEFDCPAVRCNGATNHSTWLAVDNVQPQLPHGAARNRHHNYERRRSQAIDSLKSYYSLTKPGIIRGNTITAIAGFFFASKGHIDFGLLLALAVGLSLIIASACVFNNYLDRDIDAKMARTKKRALVAGTISVQNALIYASLLGLLGSSILGIFTNMLAQIIALFGLFAYVILYSIVKRYTLHSTVIGSISGAVPPVVGYTAVTDRFDHTALILFLILVFWQMPHFYAIAMYRREDYVAAKIPVLTVKRGMRAAKIQIMLYIAAFTAAAAALTKFSYGGYTYLAIAIILGLTWLGFGLKDFNRKDDKLWGRQMFHVSLAVITTLSIMISINAWLP